MGRKLATILALAGLELLVATACIGGNASPSAVPSPAAPTASTSPTPAATLTAEEHSTLQKTMIDYYTAGQGQQHYNDSLYHDLVLTRFYINNTQTGKMGVVVRVEGTINGFVRQGNNNMLYFDITRISNPHDIMAYTAFLDAVLFKPDINYHQAPQEKVIQ